MTVLDLFHLAPLHTSLFQAHINPLPEVQMCFGSDSTVGGIKFQFATTIKKHVDQIRSARAAGKDCKDITLNSNGLLFYIFHCGP